MFRPQSNRRNIIILAFTLVVVIALFGIVTTQTSLDQGAFELAELNRAIANAETSREIPAEELYVSACYADEGPTLKRWRPRARGRATRIRKRTSHITIIVSDGEEELE